MGEHLCSLRVPMHPFLCSPMAPEVKGTPESCHKEPCGHYSMAQMPIFPKEGHLKSSQPGGQRRAAGDSCAGENLPVSKQILFWMGSEYAIEIELLLEKTFLLIL